MREAGRGRDEVCASIWSSVFTWSGEKSRYGGLRQANEGEVQKKYRGLDAHLGENGRDYVHAWLKGRTFPTPPSK